MQREEKEGSFIWLIPLFLVPLIMWGVFAFFDSLDSNDQNSLASQQGGVIPGVGGGPGPKMRDIGSSAPTITGDLQTN
jgi:hypothetical protein